VREGVGITTWTNSLLMAIVTSSLLFEIFNLVLLRLNTQARPSIILFHKTSYSQYCIKWMDETTKMKIKFKKLQNGTCVVDLEGNVIQDLKEFEHIVLMDESVGLYTYFIDKESYVISDQLITFHYTGHYEPLMVKGMTASGVLLQLISLEGKRPVLTESATRWFLILGFCTYIGEIAFLLMKSKLLAEHLFEIVIAQVIYFTGCLIVLIIAFQPQKYWKKIWNGVQKINFVMNFIFLVMLSTVDLLRAVNKPVNFIQYGVTSTVYVFLLIYWELSKFVDSKLFFLLALIHVLLHINIIVFAVQAELNASSLTWEFVSALIESNYLFGLLILVYQTLKDKLEVLFLKNKYKLYPN